MGMTTTEVARLARVTPRQLQWWDQRGILLVPMVNHRRVYTSDDALLASVVAYLHKHGLSLRQIRTLRLPGHLKAMARFLLADGIRAWSPASEAVVFAILKGARRPMVLVPLEELRQRIPKE
jgi:DNA-binding transcriptional MerR regulator